MRKTAQLLLLIVLGSLASACNPGEPEKPPSIPPPPHVEAPPAEAQRSRSGLAWIVLTPGKGTRYPRPNSQVTVHYTGWTTDGESFDSSVSRGEPASFALNEVIAGWTEGVQMMVEGEKRRFWIPAELAYGNSSRPGAPQGLLVFDIELIRIGS
jgi:FKBP-type peptidyl-prolyl cis-trans isomerase